MYHEADLDGQLSFVDVSLVQELEQARIS